jgi:CBS domain-containing protein
MMTIEEIMTTDPVSLGPGDTLARAGELMLEHRIRHIPVVDDAGVLLGLITQRDLLAIGSKDDSPDKPAQRLADIMRQQLYRIDRDSDMRSAGLLMQQHKIGSLPVTDDKGALVGIVTDSDYVSLAINLLEQLDEVSPLDDSDLDSTDDLDAFSGAKDDY